ncbi:MAG: hypothetical protein AAB227_03835 [Pseudomonadota bacterium]
MTADKLKNLMSILLIATGVLHLVAAAIGAPDNLRVPLAVFGALYASLGVWVRSGGRTAVMAALVTTATGIVLGGANYAQNGGPVTLPVMFLIDLVILGSGGMWIVKSGKAG